jgi:hypothetical protein
MRAMLAILFSAIHVLGAQPGEDEAKAIYAVFEAMPEGALLSVGDTLDIVSKVNFGTNIVFYQWRSIQPFPDYEPKILPGETNSVLRFRANKVGEYWFSVEIRGRKDGNIVSAASFAAKVMVSAGRKLALCAPSDPLIQTKPQYNPELPRCILFYGATGNRFKVQVKSEGGWVTQFTCDGDNRNVWLPISVTNSIALYRLVSFQK